MFKRKNTNHKTFFFSTLPDMIVLGVWGNQGLWWEVLLHNGAIYFYDVLENSWWKRLREGELLSINLREVPEEVIDAVYWADCQ